MKGHEAVTIDDFKGLWDRNNPDEIPLDHLYVCQNMQFGMGRVVTRQLWAKQFTSLGGVRRSYSFETTNVTFIIFMTSNGDIYTQQIFPTVLAPVFRLATSTTHDFTMVTFNSRAYICISKYSGYVGDSLYIFEGTGTFRRGGYLAPTTRPPVALVAGGNIDIGTHGFGYAVETTSGFISNAMTGTPWFLSTAGGQKVTYTGIPNYSGDPLVSRVRLIATKTLIGPNIEPATATWFFIPGGLNGGIITPGATTGTVNFYDTELLEDASYLWDILQYPPGGSFVTVYHNRLVIGAADTNYGAGAPGLNTHRLMISRVNDPETYDVTDGTLIIDPSSDTQILGVGDTIPTKTGLTDGHEYRDSLYVGKLNSMYSISDNGLVPAAWPIAKIDDGNGVFLNGMMTVLDTGGVSVEYMLVANKAGIFVFNGLFNFPEMTWKISQFWKSIIKNPYMVTNPANSYPMRGKFQFINDPYNKVIYFIFNDSTASIANEPAGILYCDYSETNVNDPQYFMNVKWSKWYGGWGGGGVYIGITSLFAFDTGTGTRLFVFNTNDASIYELGGLGTPIEGNTTLFSRITTALVKDPSNVFLHLAGFSLMQTSNNDKDTSFIPQVILRERMAYPITLPTISVPRASNPYGEKVNLANVTSQAMSLDLQADYIDIRRINLYIKPTFKTFPQ